MDGQPLEASRDIVLGKVDALEIRPSQGYFNSLRFLDWYRYLNCGYRLPCVGGTDKMGAWTPALLGIDAPFQRTITSSAKCLPRESAGRLFRIHSLYQGPVWPFATLPFGRYL